MAAIELYTPQGAEMVSGMMYEPYEQHLVGGYVRYISPHIIGPHLYSWGARQTDVIGLLIKQLLRVFPLTV